jgi:hypothetical protein
MRYLHPKLLCLVVPALVVIAYLVLVGVNYLFVSILMEFFRKRHTEHRLDRDLIEKAYMS